MPLSQDDIRTHYEQAWKQSDDGASLDYSSPVEDAVLYPLYQQLLNDLKIQVNGGRILDIGAGSGRWVRYFLSRFTPAQLVGLDFTQASVDLLARRYTSTATTRLRFERVDITQPGLELNERFDLINVMNVLFHIPEPERFQQALANLAAQLAPGGRLVSTEYLPRITMRTNWMLVRSRYDFEAAIKSAGLRIIDIRASCVFSNDPMGLDGPDAGTRGHFNQVRAGMTQILNIATDPATRQFFIQFLAEIERSILSFGTERIAAMDMPSQKLVVMGRE